MKKKKALIISVTILAVIVAILLYNKSRMEAKSRPDLLTAIPVTVAKAEKMKLTEQQSFVGTIAAHNDVAIVAETQGRVVAVLAQVGDYTPAGSVLVQVDDELKRAAYEAAEVQYEKSKKDFERVESLRKENSASDQQYESARLAFKAAEAQFVAARRQYNDTKIKTPISGVVTSRLVDVGTMVQNGMVIANVVDISKLKVKINVPEKDVFKLQVGDKVNVTTDVYPGVTFEGTISTISSKADEAHTYPVEVVMPNSKEHPLKAGMFGRVTTLSRTPSESLVIPRRALLGSTKDALVFVIENSKAQLRSVILGAESGDKFEVLSGLSENDNIVISGQNNLKDGSAVKVEQHQEN
jgi:RND family efflux transporter MFP subunit